MKKKILSLALAFVLTLALVPAAFAAGNTVEISGPVGYGTLLTITNVTSISDDPAEDWLNDEEHELNWLLEEYYYDGGPKTYYAEAPVTITIESTVYGGYHWWNTDITVPVTDNIKPTNDYGVISPHYKGSLVLNDNGTYLIHFENWSISESVSTFYVVVGGGSAPTTPAPSGKTATPTASTVYVNGAAKAFEAYTIDGNNYFKLRDLALVLNGTGKQFEVGYDNTTKAITLTSGKPYTVAGGEMAAGDGKGKTATPTASKIYLNGKELSLTVYTINGNNFFKLRDLMKALDVFVGYDNATKAITVDTSKGYVEP